MLASARLSARSSRSSHVSLVINTIYDSLQRHIAHKILKSKIEACPVNAGLSVAFRHRFTFETSLAATFGCYRFRIMPDAHGRSLVHKI